MTEYSFSIPQIPHRSLQEFQISTEKVLEEQIVLRLELIQKLTFIQELTAKPSSERMLSLMVLAIWV